jgi:hypothetical protein
MPRFGALLTAMGACPAGYTRLSQHAVADLERESLGRVVQIHHPSPL